jgi:hypothetical protein
MKKVNKVLSLVLCICVAGYTMPVFAIQAVGDDAGEVSVVKLSDAEMASIVGGGTVDAKLADYAYGEPNATAVFANRSTLSSTYSLVETDSNGNVLSTIATGPLASDSAIVVTGPVTHQGGGYVVQAIIKTDAFPNSIKAQDSEMQ